MSRVDVAQWAIAQAKEQGIKLETDRKKTRVDARTQAREAVKRARVQNHFYYALDIGALEKDGRIVPGSIKGIGIPGVTTAKNWLGSGSPRDFKLGVVTMIVQMVALGFALTDLFNNDQFNERETLAKATLAIISLSATIVETAMVSVEKSLEHPLAAFIRRQWAMNAEFVGTILKRARVAGAGAGVLAGLYDLIFNVPQAYEDKNYLLMTLYGLNGVLGISIAVAVYYAIAAIWAPLLLISFVIGISIAVINKSQLKSWISRCDFSLGEKYSSFEGQINAFKQIFDA